MIVIGIDPGVTTGVGIIQGGKLIFQNIFNMKNQYHIIYSDFVCDDISKKAEAEDDIIILYIESQFINRTSEKTNWNTLRKLIEIEGWWKHLAKKMGFNQIIEVFPRTWQSSCLSHAAKREQLKKLSIIRANQQFNIKTKDHNLADAINIASYGWQEEVTKRRIRNESIKNHG